MLNEHLKEQLAEYLALIEAPIVMHYSVDESADSKELLTFLKEIAEMSEDIILAEKKLVRTPSFSLSTKEQEARIFFYGVPLGHEFSSFVLALLHVSGRMPQESAELLAAIQQIDQPLVFETYIKLSCRNCRDAVQALNIMSAINPNISHTMIDGKLCQAEIAEKNIQKLPTVYLNDQEFVVGRTSIEKLVAQVLETINN